MKEQGHQEKVAPFVELEPSKVEPEMAPVLIVQLVYPLLHHSQPAELVWLMSSTQQLVKAVNPVQQPVKPQMGQLDRQHVVCSLPQVFLSSPEWKKHWHKRLAPLCHDPRC